MKTNQNWDNYAKKFLSLDEYHHLLPDFFDLVGNVETKRILDLGCSNGLMCRLLASIGAQMTGIDRSEKAIDLAKELEILQPLGIDYYLADATDLTVLEDSFFDSIIAVNALCSLGSEKHLVEKALDESFRVLKPGGSIVSIVPHPAFEHLQASKTRHRQFDSAYSYFKSGSKAILSLELGGQKAVIENVHWTLTDYAEFLNRKFLFCDLREPEPDDTFIHLHSDMFPDEKPFPIYLLLKGMKPGKRV